MEQVEVIIYDTDNVPIWFCFTFFLTPVSMQTTHSELPGPSTGLGADGVTGVPGVSGGLGMGKCEAFDSSGEGVAAGAVGKATSSCSSSTALHTAGRGRRWGTVR